MIYSQLYEVVVDFTRDYDQIRQALTKIDHFDKTSITQMFRACNNIFSSTWGTQNYCQVNSINLIFFQNILRISSLDYCCDRLWNWIRTKLAQECIK